MRLLDDVRLIESEILAPPIVSTFEHRTRSILSMVRALDRSSTWPASYELGDS